jgi:hypothetical protein
MNMVYWMWTDQLNWTWCTEYELNLCQCSVMWTELYLCRAVWTGIFCGRVNLNLLVSSSVNLIFLYGPAKSCVNLLWKCAIYISAGELQLHPEDVRSKHIITCQFFIGGWWTSGVQRWTSGVATHGQQRALYYIPWILIFSTNYHGLLLIIARSPRQSPHKGVVSESGLCIWNFLSTQFHNMQTCFFCVTKMWLASQFHITRLQKTTVFMQCPKKESLVLYNLARYFHLIACGDGCHTRFWGQNQMHIIYVPGFIFHIYVGVISVIYQKTMQ